jgi:light-regulated signal transduction histidine kinase (bacteriophytochrome)
LRTPLRIASNYAGILDQEFASEWDPAARQLLERIVASNSRMNMLIDELLRFSRLGRKQIVKQRVDMQAVARSVIELIHAGAPDRDIDWQIGSMPHASADPVLIEQVFSNLIGNALKYSGKEERPRIAVGFDDDGGDASYFVDDNGVGFPMSQADRLFGVFERLHREDEFEGHGIGLATVHRILSKHGGRIWAESEPGDGATFRFQLPDDD